MRFALALLALLPSAALGAINIVGPSSSAYWVQNTSNVITWTFSPGDPNPVDVLVLNTDNTTLNGPFSIAQFVNVSAMSVTVTNVTLKVGTGYQVEFVSPQNHSEVFAVGNTFEVKAPGTAPAPPSPVTNSSGSTNSSASANNTSASSTGSSSSPSATPSFPPGESTNGALALGSSSVFGIVVACGVASLAALI